MYQPRQVGWRWILTPILEVVLVFFFSSTATAVYAQAVPEGVEVGRICSLHGPYQGVGCPACRALAQRKGGTASSGGQGMSFQNQLAIDAAGQLGNAIGQMLRGDPQQEARERAEAEARAIEQQRVDAERARKKQEDFARLSSALKLDSFDGDHGALLLKGTDVAGAGGQPPLPSAGDNLLGLKLGDYDLQPRGTQAAANSGPADRPSPNPDPMVVDLRTAPSASARDSGGKLALKLGDDDAQPQVSTVAEYSGSPNAATDPEPIAAPSLASVVGTAPEPAPATTPTQDNSDAFAIEPAPGSSSGAEPAPKTVPMPTAEPGMANPAAGKIISILDGAVSSAVASLKTSQVGDSITLDRELTEIRAMLSVPPSGKQGDETVRTISFDHQKSAGSGESQVAGRILVVRNEQTGEVRIDVLQEQTGRGTTQRIIHVDRFGNISAQESTAGGKR